jgi:hypothetical protein
MIFYVHSFTIYGFIHKQSLELVKCSLNTEFSAKIIFFKIGILKHDFFLQKNSLLFYYYSNFCGVAKTIAGVCRGINGETGKYKDFSFD